MLATAAFAHPLGNFTVNTYSGLRVQPDRVVIDLVVDMAEIPAFQARRNVDADGDGAVSEAESTTYATTSCAEAASKVSVTVGRRDATTQVESAGVSFPPGTAGLPTLRLGCTLVAETGELRGEESFVFRNTYYTERVGWREVTAVGDRTTLVKSDVGTSSLSVRLTAYPEDLLSSPPDQRAATVRARPGGPPAASVAGPEGAAALPASQPRGVDAATRSFTALVARQDLSIALGAMAVALAIALGAAHALAPGHGKTILAAYLVGQRGSLRHATVIALTVTATHTVGVLVLGVVLSTSTSLAPESIYPWLGLASGLMLAAIGVGLASRALRRRPLVLPVAAPVLVAVGAGVAASGHDHAAHDDNRENGDCDLDHHGNDRHHHGGRTHSHPHLMPDGRALHWKTLVPMGLVGGMVPSPSALVVLLGAIALGRPWFGVALVVAYGLGMAATLTAAGLLLVRARGAIERWLSASSSRRLLRLAQALPLVTATCIIVGGLYLSARGVAQL